MSASQALGALSSLVMSTRSPQQRQAIIGGVAVVAILLVAAIVLSRGGDETGPAPVTTEGTAPIVTSSTTEVTVATSEVPADLPLRFATGLAARSTPAVERLVDLTATGSVARAYVLHRLASLSVVPDQPVARVEPITDGVFNICDVGANDVVCRRFTDFAVDADGLLVDFTINRLRLDDRLIALGRSGVSEDVKVSVVSAFETIPDDTVVVIAEIDNLGAEAVLINGFAAVHRGADGAEYEVVAVSGEDSIEPGATARLAFVFAGGAIGGAIVIPGSTADFENAFEVTVELTAP